MTDAALPADLLDRAPEEGARWLALRWLDAAAAARPRLHDAGDAEALHDFRVALRRLRSTLRSFRPVLGDAVPKKLRRRLARLADATNPARDAEVELAWLARRVRRLPVTARRGGHWLRRRLQEREAAARAAALTAIAAGFADLERALRKRLQVVRIDVDLLRGERPTCGRFVGGRLRELADELRADLAAVGSLADAEPAHRARLAAKRLRYLLEPLVEVGDAASCGAAADLVARLKSLQDELGDLHDAEVLAAAIADLAGEAVAERARRRLAAALAGDVAAAKSAAAVPSLVPLVERLREEQRERFAALAEDWLDGRAAPFLEAVERFAAGLAGGEAAAPQAAGEDGAP